MEKIAVQNDLILGWMESLSDPKRLRLLRLMEQHELGVAELCAVLQSPQSTISRHLKILMDNGWIRSRPQGTNHLYRMILDELEAPARRLWLVAREQSDNWSAAEQDHLRLAAVLRERTADGETFFAGAAGEWDQLRRQLYGTRFSQTACLALLSDSAVIADLGCGSGQIAADIAPFVGRVIGVDGSAAMLRAARKRLMEFPNVELRRGDLTTIPIEDSSCDAALMILALTYVPEPAAAIRGMARILKPGGKAIIVDLMPHDRDDFRRQLGQRWLGFDREQTKQWMQEAKLMQIQCKAMAAEADAKGPALFMAIGNKEI